MNQNDMKNQPRMVTPEEIQQVNHITPEELQETQVLNLKDVQEAVRFEKRTSKKPAIILGIIGIALLLSGTGFQIAMSLKEKKEEEKIVEHRREEDTVKKTYLSCSQTKLNTSNYTDDVYTFSYNFEDDKLIGVTKLLSVIPSPGKKESAEGIKKYKEAMKKYINPTRGYEVMLNDTENGFSITTVIIYDELDIATLDASQKNNIITSIDYESGESRETILEDMTKRNFTCQ
ncbi:MAG: hypothetical protein IJI58_04825 [Bacilli bacterium]|nr:hypothetical protein [Bacilli bacterium]